MDVNQSLLARVHRAAALVCSKTSKLHALSIPEGGEQAPFSFENLQMLVEAGTSNYHCGGCAGWLDFERLPAPAIPISEKQIKVLQEHYFSSPNPIPDTVCVAVTSMAKSGFCPIPKKLHHFSPSEMIFAFLFAFEASIDSKNEDEIQAWIMEILRRAIQFREDAKKNNEGLARTAVARVYEIMLAGDLTAKGSSEKADARVERFYASIRFANPADKVTTKMVALAMRIHSELLTNTEIYARVKQTEDLWGIESVFNHLHKLDVILRLVKSSKAKGSTLLFVVDTLATRQDSRLMKGEEVTERWLKGDPKKHVVPHVKILVLMEAAIDWLQEEFLTEAGKKLFQEKVYFASKCRSTFGLCKLAEEDSDAKGAEDLSEDLTWLGEVSSVERLVFEFVREIHAMEYESTFVAIYKQIPDAPLKEQMEFGAIGKQVESIRAEAKARSARVVAPGSVDSKPLADGLGPVSSNPDACSAGNTSGAEQDKVLTKQEKMVQLCSAWSYHVRQQWGAHVRLVEMPTTASKLSELRQMTKAGQFKPESGKLHKLHLIDGKVSGESASDQMLQPSLPANLLKRIVDSLCHTSSADHPLEAGEFLAILDGRQDSSSLAKTVPRKVYKHARDYGVTYDERDLEKRQERIMLESMLRQRENMLVASVQPIKLPRLQRMFCSGSNKGSELFPVPLRDLDQEPRVTAKEHHAIMKGRFNDEAKVDSENAKAGRKKWKLGEDEMLMFPYGMHQAFYRELYHSFCVSACLDYTPGDGAAALAAAEASVSYTGFVFNPEHKAFIEKKLDESVFATLGTPGSKHYRERFAEQVAEIREEPEPTAEEKAPDRNPALTASAVEKETWEAGSEIGTVRPSNLSDKDAPSEKRARVV